MCVSLFILSIVYVRNILYHITIATRKTNQSQEAKNMKLEELLLTTSEHRNMYIWDNGEIIAQYNGRDSIPEELNNREVELVDCSGDNFHVYLISE